MRRDSHQRAPEQDRHRNMAEDLVYGRTFCQIEISTILIISSCCHRRKAGGLSLEDEAGDAATVEFNVKLGSRRSRLGRRDVQEKRHEAGLAVAPAASHAAYEPQKPPRISISPKLFCKCLREKVILRSDRCPFVCGDIYHQWVSDDAVPAKDTRRPGGDRVGGLIDRRSSRSRVD